MIRFFVEGEPRPKGSMKSFVNQHTGKAALTSTTEGLPSWQNRIFFCAKDAGVIPNDDPIILGVVFCILRPKGHFLGNDRKRGLNSKGLKNHYPIPKNKLDIDKLLRAVMDGLTGVAYHDDSQVVGFDDLQKAYSHTEGVSITVRSALKRGDE